MLVPERLNVGQAPQAWTLGVWSWLIWTRDNTHPEMGLLILRLPGAPSLLGTTKEIARSQAFLERLGRGQAVHSQASPRHERQKEERASSFFLLPHSP